MSKNLPMRSEQVATGIIDIQNALHLLEVHNVNILFRERKMDGELMS
jgi:hypothetical protein